MKNAPPTPSVDVCAQQICSVAKLAFAFILFIALMLSSSGAYAASASLAWDANTESSLAGYKLYYGTASKAYGAPINVGKTTVYTVNNLNPGTYYFTVTAYNTLGQESGYSNEVSHTIAASDTTAPVITNVTAGSITVNSAALTWTTNESSDSQVEYGTTSALGLTSPLNTSMVTAHSQSLSGLAAATTYYYRVKSRDAAGDLAVSNTLTFTTAAAAADTTPPLITNLTAGSVTSSSAKLTWTTNEGAYCQVAYGTTSALGTTTAMSSGTMTSHFQSLAGLTPATTYYYSVKSKDAAGNLASSNVSTFTTTAANPTPVAGLVGGFAFTEGSGTATADVSGSGNNAVLSGTAWSANGRFGAALSFNGAGSYATAPANNLPAANSPQSIAWWFNIPSAPSGAQTMIALSNNAQQSGVQPGFKNSRLAVWQFGGTILVSAPMPTTGTWHHGAYTFDGANHGLYLDGTLVASSTVAPQAGAPSALEFGRWLSNIEFYNGLLDEVQIYNRALSASEVQTVMNSPLLTSGDSVAPTITISSPAAGATLSGTVALSANASDNAGVAGVQFLVDGAPLGAEDTAAPYTTSWNTSAAANGAHTISARARDAAGLTATATINVTVSNAALTAPPTAAYPFNEGAGSTTADVSGNGNTGTIYGATWSSDAKFGRALSFDGSDYVKVKVAKLPATNAPQTLALWFKTPSIPNAAAQNLVVLANKSAHAAVQTGFRSSSVAVWQYGGQVLVSAPAPSANAWHHLAYAFDGSTHRLYIDGNLVNTSTVQAQKASVALMELGRWADGTEYYVGGMDEVQLYNRALTQSEVQQVMTAPLGAAPAASPALMSSADSSDAMMISAGGIAEGPLSGARALPEISPSSLLKSSALGSRRRRLADAVGRRERATAAAGAMVQVEVNQPSYSGEQPVEGYVEVSNEGGDSRPVEIKTWVSIPGESPLSIANVGGAGDYMLASGIRETYAIVPVLSSVRDYPAGVYDFSSRMIDPVTGDVLFEDASPFIVSHPDSEAHAAPMNPATEPVVSFRTQTADAPAASTVAVQNTGSASVAIEVKSWLERAGANPIPLVSAGSDASIVLAPGGDFAFSPLAAFNPEAGFPAGDYVVRSRALDATTGKILAEEFTPLALP